MAINPADLLTFVQIARIALDTIADYQRGELTEEEMQLAARQVALKSRAARDRWERSKLGRDQDEPLST